MRTWDEPKKKRLHIEIIPMIDVMMFLLVFFILISLNVIPALGLKTKLPGAAHAQQLKPQNNAIITLATGDRMQLDGKDVDKDTLLSQLNQLKTTSKKLVIIIRCDEGVEVKRLVSTMDLLKGHGFQSVSIATKKL
ncbi:ExbD/TolR family protein [Gallaecimonas mangrovi]|uniref:ExbD/TolR family protein n=1 Tax=Gallaecimonas mangrovi TaxID=2291597 RepID=UPI000E1FFD10|nr:biopolymer transporter ExbD [Gallaecimonas mangrovi]